MTIECLQVLLVEDLESNIESWQDKEKSHNSDVATSGFSIETCYAKSVLEGRALLLSRRVDAVVVDLRLQPDEGISMPNDHGNALVEYLEKTHPVAIAIYSGQPQEAGSARCSQVEIFDRADGLPPVFQWLAKQRDMLLHVRATRNAVEREIAQIFFKSIWPRWTHWMAGVADANFSSTLARHVVAHVHDSMLEAGGGAAHPEETYFLPPVKERLDTGDLVNDDTGLWIVVTPRCDLHNKGKVSTVLVARCVDISKRWANAKPKEQPRLSQHDNAAKQHFLPPMRDENGEQIGPWFVQFHDLRAVPVADVESLLTAHRWASLAPQFVPSLVERFGGYFSRIGTPTLSSDA